jgi:hypothetical protein
MAGCKGRRLETGFDASAKSHAEFEPDRQISRIRLSDKTFTPSPMAYRAQAGFYVFDGNTDVFR